MQCYIGTRTNSLISKFVKQIGISVEESNDVTILKYCKYSPKRFLLKVKMNIFYYTAKKELEEMQKDVKSNKCDEINYYFLKDFTKEIEETIKRM